MASHGIARGPRTRSDEQKRLDAERIRTYRALEEQLQHINSYGLDTFYLTTRLLRLNPEYYTVWNARRRCLIYSFLSKPRSGWPSSAACSSSSPSAATQCSTGASLPMSWVATPPSQPLTGETSGPSCEENEKEREVREKEEHERQERQAREEERRLVEMENDVHALTNELQFTVPLLMEFPKCYWIWSFRLWVLQQAVLRLDVATARQIWEEELALDSKMLMHDRRNFHAWGYRRQVVEQLESAVLSPTGVPTSLVESEFDYTTKMVHRDLSNFSAWHNRSKLIPRLLEERRASDLARADFLNAELGLIRDALNVGPEDQSLWFYHQFLMINLTDYIGRPTIAPHLSLEERLTYVARELDDIRDLLTDYDKVKWIYEALLEYTIAVAKMMERPLDSNELLEAREWLARLRVLDPMRKGRWDDIESSYMLRRREYVDVLCR